MRSPLLFTLVATLAVGAGCRTRPERASMSDHMPPADAAPGEGRQGATDAGADSRGPACAVPVGSSTARALQALLDTAVEKNRGAGGGLLRIESGECGVLWEGASGRLARGVDTPIAAGDTFEVASVTKAFTAAVALQLAEDGRVDLDAPIGDHLPASVTRGLLVVRGHDYGPELTARQLLGHRGGLPDVWSDGPFVSKDTNAFVRAFLRDPDREWPPAEVLDYARKLAPIDQPGRRHHYGDTAYVLLGLLIEQLEGAPLHAVFRQRIFARLAMADTYLRYREPAPREARESHRYEDRLDLFGQRRQSADWASGGLVSSTRDLGRFAFALAGGEVLCEPASLTAMTTWQPTGKKGIDYGLGLYRLQLDRELGELWGHDGHGNSFMYRWPSRNLVFVGTLNQTRNDWWPMVASAMKLLAAPTHEGTP